MGKEKLIRNYTNCQVLVSHGEEKYRKNFPSFEQTKEKQFKCTVCCVNLTPFIVAGKSCHLHSFLKVLVCKKCLDFYGDGDFSTDEDGDEKYCRWCGQGGNLFLCEKCNSGFCKACIKRNFNRAVFEDLKKQDNWDCFMCNPKPLYELRAKAWVAEKHYLSHRKDDKKSRSKPSVQADEKTPKEKEDRTFKSEQKFIDAARKLLLESLDESKRLADQCKLQADKIQKTKMSKKHVKEVEAIKCLEDKLQVFFDSITENVEGIKANLKKNLVDWRQHYDERFKNQTNGVKAEDNNECDEAEEEEKTGVDEGENVKKEDDKVENGDDVTKDDEGDVAEENTTKVDDDDDDTKNDANEEEEEEEKEESKETSVNEISDSEVTKVDECDANDDENTTVCSDKLDVTVDPDEPLAKIRKT